MGLRIGYKAKVLRVWKTHNGIKRAAIYLYANTREMECKVDVTLEGRSRQKGLKVGDEITIADFEVVGDKNNGYMFYLYDYETKQERKKRDYWEQFIGTFDLPDENPF